MSNTSLLSIAYLLQSGFTQNDLKNLFLNDTGEPADALWKKVKDGIIDCDIPDARKEKIQEKSKHIDENAIATLLQSKAIDIITMHDERYPKKLKNIGHAPYFIFVRGTLRSDIPMIGIVGSRKNTTYATRILEKIIPDTLHAGVGIISGGAAGVDTLAHDITIAGGGYTIVVFGTGIDRCYPSGNKGLFEKIIREGGAIISHFPLGTGPEVYNFPIRNEIVAGIAHGILIPEAALSSGTLITAQLALEHGRDVFAVPGDIDRETSEGSNMLIATGQAKCVRCSGDILEEYFDISHIGNGMTPIIQQNKEFENEHEKQVYEAISGGHNRIDDIITITSLSMSDVLIAVAMLEIRGYVRLSEMGTYEFT